MNEIDAVQVMSDHQPFRGLCLASPCVESGRVWPCLPYRLAEALADERDMVRHTAGALREARLALETERAKGRRP